MSKKILLADDSITIQKVIELTFSDEDFEVVTVGNGRLAIERVQDVRPDLVLCDIIMPEKDGYEVCDFIKKNPALSRTPVLLLTGAFEPFDQERATRVGCDGFLAKPFEPQTLIARVKDLLGRAGAMAAAPRAPSVASSAPVPVPAAVAAPSPARPREAQLFAFVPEPPPAYEPPPPVLPFEEAGVSFFTDETFEETVEQRSSAAPATRADDTGPVTTFPETPDFEDYRASAFDEVAPAAPTALTSPFQALPPAATPVARPGAAAGFPALDEEDGPQTLLHVSAEEAATLRGETPPARTPAPAAKPAPAPAAPPPARAPLWTQQTMEVSLETRARVAMEAVQVDREPVFEEIFEPAPAPAPVSAHRAPLPAPAPPLAPPKEPVPAPRPVEARAEPPVPLPKPAFVPPPAPVPAPTPAAAPLPSSAAWSAPAAGVPSAGKSDSDDPVTLSARSSRDLTKDVVKDGAAVRSSVPSTAPAEAEAAATSASGVSVPVDMVSQIAQRVVAQISEKVIREVAWEVIPELAETLIKKEIERLKAELQQT